MSKLIAVVVTLLVLAAPARADTVTAWNRHATDALMVTGAQPPQQSVPHMAMVHGAIYDAVNAIDGGHEGYLLSSRTGRPGDSTDAAAATAAYRVLAHLVPAQQPTLQTHYAASLAPIADGPAKRRGIAVGEAAAAAMIAARTDDGRFGPFRFTAGTGPGAWLPVLPAFVNDPNAWLKDVTPFMVRSATQFRTEGPLPLSSHRYAREFAEVKAIGSLTSSTRTADQTLAARYWAENPPATWNRILRTLATNCGLDVVDSARLYAEVSLTAADALITVWADKARFSNWRPITAIREAATDGNPRTEADPDWLPLTPTPPYPDHSSGHNGYSGAIVATLQEFFGSDRIGWSDTNTAGLTRSYTRLSDAIDEIVEVRIWSGIHFRAADEQARRMGEQVARWRDRNFFNAVRH